MHITVKTLILYFVAILSLASATPTKLMAAESAPPPKPLLIKQVQPKPDAKVANSNAAFDHTKTGFILRDIHTTLRCEQCHVGEIFKGTPKVCSGCHSLGSRVSATPKPVNHVVTNASCDTCHVSPTSFLVSSFNHVGVIDKCSSCHNGQSLGVVSKPPTHIPTFLPCESCHSNTTTFAVARMDHTGITTGCTTCHLGQFPDVVSRPASHIPTTGGCEACHNTVTFAGATFGHDLATATNNCISCHGGTMPGVVGKPATHLITAAQCDTCHTQSNTANFSTFLGATFDHNANASIVTGKCSTCHNGSVAGANSKPSNHIVTSQQCDTCHTTATTANYTTWLGVYFDHTTIAGGPGGKCSTCHNGTAALGQPTNHIPVGGSQCDSSGCHTSVTTSNYTTFLGAPFDHASVTGGVAAKCSTCHGGNYSGVTAKPSNHLVTTAQCDSCHTQSNTANYTTFLGAGQDHSSYTSATNCETGCHNGVNAVGKTAGHIPLTGIVGSCGSCHAKYSSPSATTFYPAAMNHTLIGTARCDSCHISTYASQGVAGGAQPKVSNHIPTAITGLLDCTTCHNITNTTNSSGMSWLTEKMNHNSAQGGGTPAYCVTCHLSGVTYLGNMQKKSHNGASTAKDCSSSSCHKPIGKTGSSYSSWN